MFGSFLFFCVHILCLFFCSTLLGVLSSLKVLFSSLTALSPCWTSPSLLGSGLPLILSTLMEPLPPPSSLRNLGVSQSTNDLVTYERVCAGRVFCVLPESLLKWQFGIFQLCPEVPVKKQLWYNYGPDLYHGRLKQKNNYDTIMDLICIMAVKKQLWAWLVSWPFFIK